MSHQNSRYTVYVRGSCLPIYALCYNSFDFVVCCRLLVLMATLLCLAPRTTAQSPHPPTVTSSLRCWICWSSTLTVGACRSLRIGKEIQCSHCTPKELIVPYTVICPENKPAVTPYQLPLLTPMEYHSQMFLLPRVHQPTASTEKSALLVLSTDMRSSYVVQRSPVRLQVGQLGCKTQLKLIQTCLQKLVCELFASRKG